MTDLLERYRLVEQLLTPDDAVIYWRGYDLTLDREVVIRTLVASDQRAEALRRAARSSALIEDRRLIRVLDVVEVPAADGRPALIAVVNEWVGGHTLASIMRSRDWEPLDVDQAVGIVTEVAQAMEVAHEMRVRHGRIVPTSVVMTDAAEVRVIGMCVDAVLLGSAHEDLIRCDVDALGGLLYFLLTGRSPFFSALMESPDDPDRLRAAPRHRSHVEPASHVRADIPPALDLLISRAMLEQRRPRGTSRIRTVSEFLLELTRVRDDVDPVAVPRTSHRLRTWLVRGVLAVAVLAALALVVVAYRQLFIGPGAPTPRPSTSVSAVPRAVATASAARPVRLPVASVTTYDPLGDDDGNGTPDGAAGREHQGSAALAVDGRPSTAWSSQRYGDPHAAGKGGVGLVLDLGSPQTVSAVRVHFSGLGAAVRIGVADAVQARPDAWPLLTQAPAGRSTVNLRAARPLTGRYVLVWFPRLPALTDLSHAYQVRVSQIAVRGSH